MKDLSSSVGGGCVAARISDSCARYRSISGCICAFRQTATARSYSRISGQTWADRLTSSFGSRAAMDDATLSSSAGARYECSSITATACTSIVAICRHISSICASSGCAITLPSAAMRASISMTRSRAISGSSLLTWKSKEDGMRQRAISSTSRVPRETTSATRATLRCRTAFSAIVVPCTSSPPLSANCG